MSYTPPPLRADEERTWAILVHVIAGGLNLITGGLFAGLIGAIVVYVVFKDRGPFIRQHATTTLNFQITLVIAEIIGLILTLAIIGFFLLAAIWIVNIIFSILGALAANRGEPYYYPLAIRFFK
ncbi:DUF4870 domain-containing protein [Gryllotalpicola protaetiae]|uniref:DUF4870 domain-containing protein n=1 Tax=Gryllotalpicola protaetiae TaxID=2419771 RepID=A0A387BMP5_9MICO|nr:DUF4870 domain-containing protein [Gryllotalpicola protaetiae]AYG05093.1 DUF4870 domain-containing protein [Gryllotalpicola protaetiae]